MKVVAFWIGLAIAIVSQLLTIRANYEKVPQMYMEVAIVIAILLSGFGLLSEYKLLGFFQPSPSPLILPLIYWAFNEKLSSVGSEQTGL